VNELALSDGKKKGFFQKPENITSLLILMGLGLLGFKFLDVVLPALNRVLDYALETTFKTVLLGSVLAIVTWVVTSKDLHKLAGLGYMMLMRKLTTFVVELDPIEIMRGYRRTLDANLDEISKGIGDLRGQARALEEQIQKTADKLQRSQALAFEAQKRASSGQTGMKTEFLLQARKAGRLEKSGTTYQGLLARIKAHIAVMMKIQEAAKFMVADIEDTIEEESKKREMVTASFKAMKGARRILAANDQRELYDMALEANARDYSAKLGEIEQFMEDSKHFINTMDLENGVYEEEALAKLGEWEKRSQNLLTGGTGKTHFQLSAPPQHDFSAIDRDIEEKLEKDDFSDLFSKI
jgi:hypothetical protein